MLKSNNILFNNKVEGEIVSNQLYKSFNSLKVIFKRHSKSFLILMICVTLLGFLYLFMTPAIFIASGTMVIDTHRMQLSQLKLDIQGNNVALDPGLVQTEMEIVKSKNISYAVINKLKLTEDQEFVGSSWFAKIRGTITGLFSTDKTETPLIELALTVFENQRTVGRIGLTYGMEIGFRSLDPVKSAKITNAIAEAYVREQLDVKYQATVRASIWLQERLNELQLQTANADKAVVDFKHINNIVTVQAANDTLRLMNDQQLSEINTQQILARSATAEAKARLDRIEEVLKQNLPDASVADIIKSEIIIKLRNQYLELVGREHIFAERYGVNHLATLNLRTQILETRRGIKDEIKRIAESYKSDYEIALTREKSLESSFLKQIAESQTTHNAQVQLLGLESKAKSYRITYDSFMARYMESVQQQSFPITEARLISPATPPLIKSEPKGLIILTLSTISGFMLCFVFACYKELSDRVFRTKLHVKESLGVNCITTLPILEITPTLETNSNKTLDFVEENSYKVLIHKNPTMNYVVNNPFSEFAEGLRSLKVVMDLNSMIKSNKIVGLTSTSPGEGKSTIASNFAHILAHAGRKVILIDCDLRKFALSKQFTPDASNGLIQILGGKIHLDDCIWVEPLSGLTFLPAPALSASKLLHPDEIIGSDKMQKLIEQLGKRFDVVIIDLPPLLPVTDARVASNFIDSYVYVIEYGKTNRDVTERTLVETSEVHDRLLGVVLNKVNIQSMARYEGNPYKEYTAYQ